MPDEFTFTIRQHFIWQVNCPPLSGNNPSGKLTKLLCRMDDQVSSGKDLSGKLTKLIYCRMDDQVSSVNVWFSYDCEQRFHPASFFECQMKWDSSSIKIPGCLSSIKMAGFLVDSQKPDSHERTLNNRVQ